MEIHMGLIVIVISVLLQFVASTSACSNGQCKLQEDCSLDSDCANGLFCLSCSVELQGSKCVRSTITDQFKILLYIKKINSKSSDLEQNNSLPFNKYAFLTTHNSFAIQGEPHHTPVPRLTFTNQEDTVTDQLNHGIRALMLDTYDFKGDIWLCHSFKGECQDFTAFREATPFKSTWKIVSLRVQEQVQLWIQGPAIDTLREIESFLSENPTEIVTIILEDYVETPNGLTKIFNDSGLMKYWFPVSKMPQNGEDWPLVKDMVANNQRLIVFTSKKNKQQSEGIAYQWNFMVENQYGNDGLKGGCSNRAESTILNDKTKSLVLVNHFGSIPLKEIACKENSARLLASLQTCYTASGNRWANFVAVDFYKRSDGIGAFGALDKLNGELLCGCNDVNACVAGSSVACAVSGEKKN